MILPGGDLAALAAFCPAGLLALLLTSFLFCFIDYLAAAGEHYLLWSRALRVPGG